MKMLLLAAVTVIGLTAPGHTVAAELDLNDRPAMMQLGDDLLRCVIASYFMALGAPEGPQRRAHEEDARNYSIAVLHLYKLLKVLDAEALARRRWNAMFRHVKWADTHDELDIEMKICNDIRVLQSELLARWQLSAEEQ